jgi:hypothetical protein
MNASGIINNLTNDNTNSQELNILKELLLTKDSNNDSVLFVNDSTSFKPGNVIQISDEKNIVQDINYESNYLILNSKLNGNYKAGIPIKIVFNGVPNVNTLENKPGTNQVSMFTIPELPNQKEDVNYEMSTLPMNTYEYQGPPMGPLECRKSTIQNPAGTINVTEYDSPPRLYGTCINTPDNDIVNNIESTVSQRVDDLLFHKGNSQNRFTPVSIDTLPNNQESFANWCYGGNTINPKYASVFVNEPAKFKEVIKVSNPTGTENGGGGG